MSTLEIILYVAIGVIVVAYCIKSIYRMKHPKKEKKPKKGVFSIFKKKKTDK